MYLNTQLFSAYLTCGREKYSALKYLARLVPNFGQNLGSGGLSCKFSNGVLLFFVSFVILLVLQAQYMKRLESKAQGYPKAFSDMGITHVS